jgi:hypothetical protein
MPPERVSPAGRLEYLFCVRKLLVLASCAVWSLGVFAQAPANPMAGPAPLRNDTMHLTVHTSMSDTVVAPGKRVTLTFDVTPKRSMHVYAPGKHDYQVIVVKVEPQPWLKVEPTAYPPSEIYHFKELDEKVETYGKPFKLVQDLTILNTAAAKKALASASPIKLSGRLEYQACDDKVCYAPTKVPVSFELSVK